MDWEKLDWNALDRLREGFLTGSAARGVYWRSSSDLENYDLTYGERIGWKWDAVLAELIRRGWNPSSVVTGDINVVTRGVDVVTRGVDVVAGGADPGDRKPAGNPKAPASTPPATTGAHSSQLTLVDWGCGSGIAGRRVIEAFGVETFSTLLVWDHSPLAREFALQTAKRRFPTLTVGELRDDSPIDLLVVSHVLNELSPEGRRDLLAFVERARALIWVEPGTHAVSRDLIGIRETLRNSFHVIAPCTHSERCGLLAPENAQHWCHYFASPPPAIYADSDWVKFGQRAGIDLRSLPYCFLVAERSTGGRHRDADTGAARIVGDARHFKGYAKLLSCDAAGVTELTLQKRDDPALFKALKRESGVPIYRWRRENDRIKDAQALYPPPAASTVDEPPASATQGDDNEADLSR